MSITRRMNNELTEEIERKYQWFIDHLNVEGEEINQGKKQTATDDIIIQLDIMASEDSPQYNLECGKHYWRTGNLLYLDLTLCFPRYRRFIRSQGLDTLNSITSNMQLGDLLQRETYFHSISQHPQRPSTVHVLDLAKLSGKGVQVSNFQEGKPD